MTDAPLKENLAAAVLALGGVDPAAPFLDPMAGSGTLAIEQALRAPEHRPRPAAAASPSSAGPSQAHAAALAARCATRPRPRALPAAPAPIVARDVAPAAIAAARRNAEAAGVAARHHLRGRRRRAACARPTPPAPWCTNPPYGERLDGARPPIYEALADTLQRFAAWRLVLLSGNPQLSRVFLRRPDITHRLWNGPIETRLLVYQPRA